MTEPPSPVVALGVARAAAARLLSRLEREPAALRLAVGGEVRRMQPWVTGLDLLATAHEPAPLLDALAGARGVRVVLERAARLVRVALDDGLSVRLEVLEDEADVDRRLAAEAPAAAEDLLAPADVLGVAGLHTREGRGRYGADEMAARAQREGYAWALMQPAPQAPPSTGLALLAAVELEVPADTPPPRLLPHAWILATPVPALRSDGGAATRALVDALDGGGVDVAVPRGPGEPRVERGYDVAALVAALARAGSALAIAPPPRHAEPEPGLVQAAVAAGVPLLLLADAHDLLAVEDQLLAVGLARRGGARRADVLNALPAAQAEEWRRARRARRA